MVFGWFVLSQQRAEGFELLLGVEIACLEDDVVVRRLDLALVLLFVVLHILDIGRKERAVFDLSLLDLGIGYARAVDGDFSEWSRRPPARESAGGGCGGRRGRWRE